MTARIRNTTVRIDVPEQMTHGIRSERWRYIHYADGSEELYDMHADPHEWTNLAHLLKHAAVIEQHRRWLPTIDRELVPDSAARVLTYDKATEMMLIMKIETTCVRVSSKALKPRIRIKLIENATRPKLSADKTYPIYLESSKEIPK